MLHQPELGFFKVYVEQMGGKIPPRTEAEKHEKPSEKATATGKSKSNESDFSTESGKKNYDEPLDFTKPMKEDKVASEPEESSEVSADEVSSEQEESSEDLEKLLPEDEKLPDIAPTMEKELTDEDYDKLGDLKMAGNKAMRAGENINALDLMTQAILIGEPSALLYARRASVLLKMKRPIACIRDCTEALKLNPDSAKAYKTRGKAYRKLHKWEEANKDLGMGQRIDYDDETQDILKVVNAKWKVIRTKKLGRNSRNEERESRRRVKRVTRARKEAKKRVRGTKKKRCRRREEEEEIKRDAWWNGRRNAWRHACRVCRNDERSGYE